jgi:predicted RNA-binding protein with PIN domain
MPYLIDGHNLIPHAGLRLESLDDEMELVWKLQEFCRLSRRKVEVFFDGAPPGSAGTRRLGAVTAHFVRAGSTADDAIRRRLGQLGAGARNWVVVSSDRQVQAAAREAHSDVQPAEQFARLLAQRQTAARKGAPGDPRDGAQASSEDVDEWLRLFREREAKRPRV